MQAAASILTFPYFGAGQNDRHPIAFTPFIEPDEAERVRSEGHPSDDLEHFLSASLGKLQRQRPDAVQPYQAAPPQEYRQDHVPAARERYAPASAPVPAQPDYGHHAGSYGHDPRGHAANGASLRPEHPAYEAPRPTPIDLGHGQGFASSGLAQAFPQSVFPAHAPVQAPVAAPAQAPAFRPQPAPAPAPIEDSVPFEVPSFLQRRPGIPQQVAQASAPAARIETPASAPAIRASTRPAVAGFRAIASDIAWVYSVFPAVLAVQILAGLVWEPLSTVAATIVFVAYAALSMTVRPAVFQLRASAGWQVLATVAAFRSFNAASTEQWVHMFAAFAATAVVLVAMGGIEVYQRLKAR